MEQDETVPLTAEQEDDGQMAEQQGFTARTADTGQSVLDIGGMVADLEAARRERGGV